MATKYQYYNIDAKSLRKYQIIKYDNYELISSNLSKNNIKSLNIFGSDFVDYEKTYIDTKYINKDHINNSIHYNYILYKEINCGLYTNLSNVAYLSKIQTKNENILSNIDDIIETPEYKILHNVVMWVKETRQHIKTIISHDIKFDKYYQCLQLDNIKVFPKDDEQKIKYNKNTIVIQFI